MSPRCPRCPPVLLALLLGLARSQGSQECRDQAVIAGGSLCLVPEKPSWEWMEIHWRVKMDSGSQYKIVTASRDRDVQDIKGHFLGRAKFHWGNLSLCISPIHKTDSGVYKVEFENSSGNVETSGCFRVSVWDPIPEPSLQSQILQQDRGWCLLSLYPIPEPSLKSQIQQRDQGWCLLSLLCSSPGNGNRFQWISEDAEPQICHCNLSNPAGWRAAQTSLTCTGILGNLGLWAALGVGLILILVLIVMLGVWRRKRRKENSREDPPGAPAGSLEPLSVYAEVGARNASMPRKDDGTTIYTTVTPRTLEHPRNREQPGSVTVYATVQRPSSMKRKRLERALVSTAYLEDNGDYGKFGFPNPKS
ncbi:uncharacterized protein LOC117008635 [Catharus ustulatus]|uniref:uncharacterized protein LOC117008635 n=1 Tax=Catharus ustulatus TaxID=91951 RepID=UPI001407EBBB|nr:uncharacterized protein LOC117008635 [Catharus ustulatus]